MSEEGNETVSDTQEKCWNLSCIATDCDGVHHVDVTGHPWTQQRGSTYNPAKDRWVMPEDDPEMPWSP